MKPNVTRDLDRPRADPTSQGFLKRTLTLDTEKDRSVERSPLSGLVFRLALLGLALPLLLVEPIERFLMFAA